MEYERGVRAARVGIINLNKRIVLLRKKLKPLEDAQVELYLKKMRWLERIIGVTKIPIGVSGKKATIEIDPVALWSAIPLERRKKMLENMKEDL